MFTPRIARLLGMGLWLAACTLETPGSAAAYRPLHSLQTAKTTEADALWAVLSRGPHTCPAEQAVVGIEVTNRASDGAVTQRRHANGMVLRCDGFILAPSRTFDTGISVAGRAETAGTQTVAVILNPGTDRLQRVVGRRPRHIPHDVAYVAFKVNGIHAPAAPTVLPDSLKPGDTVQIVYTEWDAGAGRFGAPVRQTGTLSAAVASGAAELKPGEVALAPPLENVPAGAVVVGQDGKAVGLITGSGVLAHCDRFLSYSVLDSVTNCVTPEAPPAPPSAGEHPDGAAGPADGDMVSVPGGPFVVPSALHDEQPDLEGAEIACVASFKIDRLAVTNRDYLAFWLTLPERDRRRLGFQSRYYPASWSKDDAPFPGSLSDLPVLGVPLPGAAAYAKGHGKRLLTPYEWCLAAFGPKGETTVEWAKHYVEEREQIWARVRNLHIDFLRAHPELQHREYFSPSPFALPWYATGIPAQNAALWSKQVTESLTEPLWAEWKDPMYVLPVGSRGFDVSPYGVQDVMLNTSELVAPSPAAPALGRARYMTIEWTQQPPEKDDPWIPRGIPALDEAAPLPPLSRLYRRAFLSPPTDELLTLSHMSEEIAMLAPLGGWELRFSSAFEKDVSGLLPRNPPGSPVIRLGGTDLYGGMPKHFRPEMGLPVPFDTTDRSLSGGPQLYYLLPTGFRCAK